MASPRHPTICAYCGAPPTTRDHIPPECFFALPLPPRLITVPACKECNEDFRLDDEYFRLAILIGDYEKDFPKMFRHSINAIRKLADPKKAGFRTMLSASFRTTSHASGTAALDVDAERVLRVVERIACGLYFHHLFRRLPERHERNAGLVAGRVAIEMEAVLAHLSTLPFHEIGDGAFRYRYALLEDDESSAWELEFLKLRRFVFLNCPPEPGAETRREECIS